MLARKDMIILGVAAVAIIAAIGFGASIKNLPATDTRKIDGYKAATVIFSLIGVAGVAWFGYRWYKNNGSALKDRLPAALKGGASYQRY